MNEIEPLFTKRDVKNKYQVRFWTKSESYRAFTVAADKEGLVYQDVFNTLMDWFTEASARGQLNIRVEEWKP